MLRVAPFLLASIVARTASLCTEPDHTDLIVFLYDGTVRDEDPDYFEGESDTACVITVGVDAEITDILLNTNSPNFMQFVEFGCAPVDATFSIICYDWDSPEPLVRDEAIVFESEPLSTWPTSGDKRTLKDKKKGKYRLTYKFIYSSSSSGSSSSCRDDPQWFYKREEKDCGWVAEKPYKLNSNQEVKYQRCKKKHDGVKAKDACRESCGTC